jgi:hypothetical protein
VKFWSSGYGTQQSWQSLLVIGPSMTTSSFLSGHAHARSISAQLRKKNRPGAGAAADPRPGRHQARASVDRAGPVTNAPRAARPIGGPGAEDRPISLPDRLEDPIFWHEAEALILYDAIFPPNAFAP